MNEKASIFKKKNLLKETELHATKHKKRKWYANAQNDIEAQRRKQFTLNLEDFMFYRMNHGKILFFNGRCFME